ncbi:MAG: hypothetical protein ACKVQB_13670 [Bacteroidia bacterium]
MIRYTILIGRSRILTFRFTIWIGGSKILVFGFTIYTFRFKILVEKWCFDMLSKRLDRLSNRLGYD